MLTRPDQFKISLADESATLALGASLAGRLVTPPLLIFLEGELGAGKTTLVRGILRALNYQARVVSPTYTLMEEYEVEGINLVHLDLYRINDSRELEFLGLNERLGDAVVMVEWPERGAGWLPPPDLSIRLTVSGSGRQAELSAHSPRGANVMADLAASGAS